MLNKPAVCLAVMLAAAGAVFAQTSVSLEAEIQNMEKIVNKQGGSAFERYHAIVRLARLRQLTGDIEGAAKNWQEAAAAVPNMEDDDALLSCAYCLAAMGEWDRAASALEPLLHKSSRARFLDAGIKAAKSGDTSALAAMAGNPQYQQMKSEIYFMLWKMSGTADAAKAESWRQRLIVEFPQSPEGRLAAGQTSAVVVKPSPFLLLLGGLDSLPVARTETVTRTPVHTEAAVPSPPEEKPTPPAPTQISVSQTESVKLQTGLFGQKANAEAQMAKLKKAGFSPLVEQRVTGSGEMWAVVVPAGPDTNRGIKDLKNAGFDSFPLK